jgi:uncharacterized membrane protein YqiK
MKNIILLLVLFVILAMSKTMDARDNTQDNKKEPNPMVQMAEIASKTAVITAQQNRWTEESRQQVELAKIQAEREVALTKIKEETFNNKVNLLMSDGMSAVDAMYTAKEFTARTAELRRGEEKLMNDREAFESEKYWIGAKYFTAGCAVTGLGVWMYARM